MTKKRMPKLPAGQIRFIHTGRTRIHFENIYIFIPFSVLCEKHSIPEIWSALCRLASELDRL